MRLRTLYGRSLLFHWRTNAGVVLGVAVGTAVLTGALIVGDSMRGSLRDAALGRLGRVDYALLSNRFFHEALATDLTVAMKDAAYGFETSPAILLSGGSVNAATQARANRINIVGVDERFWSLRAEGEEGPAPVTGRAVILNEPLATELGVAAGDDVLLRIGKPSPISTETLLGRRDDTTLTLRLTVASIIPAEGLGAFSLKPRQYLPRNAFVPLATLQRALKQTDRVNALLTVSRVSDASASAERLDILKNLIAEHVDLADLGLTLRVDERRGYLALESSAMLIPPAVENILASDDATAGFRTSAIVTYLANTIARQLPAGGSGGVNALSTVIPYSTVVALDPNGPTSRAIALTSGEPATSLRPGEILLNEWAAEDLHAKPGDDIRLSYYVTGAFGRLETRNASFRLRGVIALQGAAADPGFTPEYEGVTDMKNLADWDPPFPMDLSLIRDRDEDYWDKHRATPKAFISLEDGLRLWAHDGDRFGRLTSIRLYPNEPGADLTAAVEAFERSLIQRIDPAQFGLSFEPVRNQMIQAGKGSTDFGMLFIGFSFFLIASACMLVALLFRLSVEQRSKEIGLKLAVGFEPSSVAKHSIIEGAVLASIGSAVGIVAAIGYAWLMLAGLRTWWSEAVNTPFLRLHVATTTMVIGLVAGLLIALLSIAWSIRGLMCLSARSLLAGRVAIDPPPVSRSSGKAARYTSGAAVLLALVAAASPMVTDALPPPLAFFLSGAAALVAGLSFFAARLRGEPQRVIDRPGGLAFWRLAIRNARRQTRRSILTASLIASATFLVTALEAFHLDADTSQNQRASGTGGFALFAESTVPLVYDLNDPDGREALGLLRDSTVDLGKTVIIPFRLRPGDESSCLNLYRPTKPRILGAGDRVIERGGFGFSKTIAETEEERSNPWTLLSRTFADGAVPVIGDEAAVLWQLHLGLGKDLVITDEGGREVRLRFVALLAGSMLQDEFIVAESQFARMFPSIGGHAFFLIDTTVEHAHEVEDLLERELSAFGFDVGLTKTRLENYLAVQNTYLSTFQSLGGLGLLLGSVGLAAVLLRNAWERRGELALMRAVGYSRRALGCIVLSENLGLLLVGLSVGMVSALLAIAPQIMDRPSSIPWLSLGVTLLAVFATGLITGALATATALRAPLIPSLRAE